MGKTKHKRYKSFKVVNEGASTKRPMPPRPSDNSGEKNSETDKEQESFVKQ